MEPVKRAEAKSSPAPPVKTSTPSATPVSVPARPSVAKDILKDLELPPDAPKFGELTPAKVSRSRGLGQAEDLVPDLPRIPDVPEHAMKISDAQRTSISEELDRELEEELKKVKEFKPAAKLDIPKEAPIRPAPQQEAAIPQVKAPQTQLKTSGSSGRIRSGGAWRRSSKPVGTASDRCGGQTYSAVVRFRYYRNGTVKDVSGATDVRQQLFRRRG